LPNLRRRFRYAIRWQGATELGQRYRPCWKYSAKRAAAECPFVLLLEQWECKKTRRTGSQVQDVELTVALSRPESVRTGEGTGDRDENRRNKRQPVHLEYGQERAIGAWQVW